jgi:uncharacterized membrane protein
MGMDWILVLTVAAALGCGLIAGFFLAFSACVMTALSRVPANQGIATMQLINVVVLNPAFLSTFLGTAIICAVLAVASLLGWDQPSAGYRLIASALYLVGTILVTIAFNVPRTDALASVKSDSAEGASLWATYVPGWTAWNHVRLAAALLAAALFTIALR